MERVALVARQLIAIDVTIGNWDGMCRLVVVFQLNSLCL